MRVSQRDTRRDVTDSEEDVKEAATASGERTAASRTPLRRPPVRLMLVGAISGVLVAGLALVVGGGWLAAIGLRVSAGAWHLSLGFGRDQELGRYWARHPRQCGGRGGPLAVQRDADERVRELEARREAQQRQVEDRRQRAADRQSLQLTLGLQPDLRRIDLRRRDLRGFFLRGKKLNAASLDDAQLQRADLAESDLRDATADQARFDGADLSETDLRGMQALRARFDRADLSFTDLRDAFLVSVPPPGRGRGTGSRVVPGRQPVPGKPCEERSLSAWTSAALSSGRPISVSPSLNTPICATPIYGRRGYAERTWTVRGCEAPATAGARVGRPASSP